MRGPEEGFTVSPAMWAALALVIARADGGSGTFLVREKPRGDAAIQGTQAKALHARSFITVDGSMAWPTDAGRKAYASHVAQEERKARRAR